MIGKCSRSCTKNAIAQLNCIYYCGAFVAICVYMAFIPFSQAHYSCSILFSCAHQRVRSRCNGLYKDSLCHRFCRAHYHLQCGLVDAQQKPSVYLVCHTWRNILMCSSTGKALLSVPLSVLSFKYRGIWATYIHFSTTTKTIYEW